MELDSVIKNHRKLFNNERIPYLSIDNQKKRFIFSRKISGENLIIRYPFSKIKTYRDYSNMLLQCQEKHQIFEDEATLKDENDRSSDIQQLVGIEKLFKRHSDKKVSKKFSRGVKKAMKNHRRNTKLRLQRRERKRIRFIKCAPLPLKMRLAETLQTFTYDSAGLEESRKNNIDPFQMTDTTYEKLRTTAEKFHGVKMKIHRGLGTYSLRQYKKNKRKKILIK